MKKIFILILSLTLSRFIDGQIPTLLKDINSGASNGIGAFTIYRFSNYGLFIAYDGSLSTQIWNTDGTTNGTTLIADFPLGQTVSSPQFVDTINGYLILFAGDSTSGSEFYSLDENLNLQLLNDMTPGTGNSSERAAVRAGAVFAAMTRNNCIWSISGWIHRCLTN